MIVNVTDEQRRQMEDQGYCILERVFSPQEMAEVTGLIEGFHERQEEDLRKRGGSAGISRAGEINFTSHLAEQDERIAAFCRRPEFVAIAMTFLGPDVDLYWNQSVFKQPEGKKEFPWHQDDGYTPVTPSPYLTLWLALNDATVENGCVSVLPGSYKQGRVPHEPSPIGLICHSNDDPDQGVLVPLKAGSIAAFWSLTMHKSGPNVSNGVRKAYIVQYSKAGLRNALTNEPIRNRISIIRDGRPVTH